MEWIGGCWTSLNHVLISKFYPSLTPTSGCWYSMTLWHNPNAHIVKHRIKWESETLTTYATVGKKCQWAIPQTHVYHVFISSCIYMQVWLCDANTFEHMYAAIHDVMCMMQGWQDDAMCTGICAWCKHLKHMLNEGFDERDVQIIGLGRLVWEVDVLVRKSICRGSLEGLLDWHIDEHLWGRGRIWIEIVDDFFGSGALLEDFKLLLRGVLHGGGCGGV
jgi:hypothetical protein